MTNEFLAGLKTCDKCEEKYTPAYQSVECPHERRTDLTTNPYLLTEEEMLSFRRPFGKPADTHYRWEITELLLAQIAKCIRAISDEIQEIFQDWDKWTDEEGGEEKWQAKYGYATTDLIRVIEERFEALKREIDEQKR